MDILVIDREALTNQLIVSRLGAKGHKVIAEPNKQTAFELVRNKGFDCIMVDPAPLSEARPVMVGLWKNITTPVRPYVLLLSKTATTEDAIQAGANDVMHKPLSSQDLESKIGNADRLLSFSRWLAQEDGAHSASGMVGRAAFHQLFLSASDRAFRYGERSLIVFVAVTNHADIEKALGAAAFEDMVNKFMSQMTYMRRQSDVIGRISNDDFAILLQRPQYESEPVDAINRFAEALERFHHSFEDKANAPRLRLTLVEIPQGVQHAERTVPGTEAVGAAQAPHA